MDAMPVHRRGFFAFLSHSHADKAIVSRLESWLSEVAEVPIWYDGRHLPRGVPIAAYLAEAIAESRSMIVVLSNSSINSGWVREEYNAAIAHRTKFDDYRIIPVRIEDCKVPEFLETTAWIDMLDGELDVDTASKLLVSLYYDDVDLELGRARDLYISRSWRESESLLGDYVCRLLVKAGFRLIGDSRDQAGFGKGERVESIISSCGGLAAILPDRGNGKTSEYMINEIQIAQQMNLPCMVVAEETVELPDVLPGPVIRVKTDDIESNNIDRAYFLEGLDHLSERWKGPPKEHYVFFCADFDPNREQVNKAIKKMVQRVTAMPCIFGDDIREGLIQQIITDRISGAFILVADISDDNLNTCIEAGIARGAKTRFHLVAAEPRRKPPFMFRDQQVWYYSDDISMLGTVHRIVYPYRRRILNYELPRIAPLI
jgi:hypothetical protein